MLEYGLNEVGPIVAQLDLEEGVSDMSDEEDEEELFLVSEYEDESSAESEDENGATKRLKISDRYRRQMEQLEQKLGLKSMQNLGPEPPLPAEVATELNKPPAAEAARKAAIARAEAVARADQDQALNTDKPRVIKKGKKKVSFANELDVAPDSTQLSTVSTPATGTFPISPSVIERDPSQAESGLSTFLTPEPKNISRFKAARVAEPATVESTTQLMSSTIVERSGPKNPKDAPAPDPNDINEILHKQEIASEYHRMRNKMIMKQGGFVGDGANDNYGELTAPIPMIDEETGKVKKISRFKAARLQ